MSPDGDVSPQWVPLKVIGNKVISIARHLTCFGLNSLSIFIIGSSSMNGPISTSWLSISICQGLHDCKSV